MGPLRHSVAALTAVVGLPVALTAAALRPVWRRGLGERLGLTAGTSAPPGALWVHAASVGEAQAALRLVDPLAAAGRPVVLSTTTWTGRQVAQTARADLCVTLAPFDHPWAIAKALGRVQPTGLVLIETELWPSWIAAVSRRGLPVVIASGRLSDRSFPNYLRWKRWLAPTLSRITAVGARSAEDAERFVKLGVAADRVEVTGDLKLEPQGSEVTAPSDLQNALGGADYWVAGSTHPGEECAAFAANERLRKQGHPAVLVVAPRHPQKWEAAAEALRAAGAAVTLRSQLSGRPLMDGDVLLLDSLGELASVYAGSQAAFVGGTLQPIGGHNLLEPLQAGVPVLYGPHTGNVRSHVALLSETQAGCAIASKEELADGLVRWFREPELREAAVQRGLAALDTHRGATERTLALLGRVGLGVAS